MIRVEANPMARPTAVTATEMATGTESWRGKKPLPLPPRTRGHPPGRMLGPRMKMRLLVLALGLFTVLGCQRDQALIDRQKTILAQQEQAITELKDTMDEQGEVIVEQIQMMAEMQQTIDKQRVAMRETSESLRLCSQRM
jgi:hypothetical protein